MGKLKNKNFYFTDYYNKYLPIKLRKQSLVHFLFMYIYTSPAIS